MVLTLYGHDDGARLTLGGGEPHTLRVFTNVDGELAERAPAIDDDSTTSEYDREIAAFVRRSAPVRRGPCPPSRA